jgi:hypothetical protein
VIHVIERGTIDQGLIAEIENTRGTTLLADIEIMTTVQTQESVIGRGLGQMRDTTGDDTTGQGLDHMRTVEGEGNSRQRDRCLLSLVIFTKVK